MNGQHQGSAPTAMPQVTRIAKGAHASPDDGACVLELASMLAGEKFSDHPRSVCPVLGTYMRALNDRLGEEDRQPLYHWAAELVGTRGSWKLRRRRAILCARWATEMEADPARALRVPTLFYWWHADRCARLAVARGIGFDIAAMLLAEARAGGPERALDDAPVRSVA